MRVGVGVKRLVDVHRCGSNRGWDRKGGSESGKSERSSTGKVEPNMPDPISAGGVHARDHRNGREPANEREAATDPTGHRLLAPCNWADLGLGKQKCRPGRVLPKKSTEVCLIERPEYAGEGPLPAGRGMRLEEVSNASGKPNSEM